MVGQQHTNVADGAAHDGLVDVIGEVVLVRLAKISLHRVAQRIERAGDDLLKRHGHRVVGVEEGKICLCAPECALDLFVLVGDDRAVVHLGASAEHRDDGAQRDELRGAVMLGVLKLPQVLAQHGLRGNDLAAVGDRAAANRQNQVNMVFFCQLRALLHFGVGGVGHDAGELDDIFARAVQDVGDFRIHTVALDGTAAVGQQHIGAVIGQQAFQILFYAALPKIDLGGVFKNEVVHSDKLLSCFLPLV